MTLSMWLQLLMIILRFLMEYVFPAAAGATVGVVASRTVVARKAAELMSANMKAGNAALFTGSLETYVREAVKQVQAEAALRSKKA